MNEHYRSFFGFTREPFVADLAQNEILETEAVTEVKTRFDYVVRLGAVGVVTGEIGSGKSTALRFASGTLHPSEYQVFYVTASSGSILELYRQILEVLSVGKTSNSRAVLTALIRKEIAQLVEEKKLRVALIIDEASLLRLEVFAELHTICQFHKDSKHYLPLILAGQANLVDKLMYRASAPLASRVVARSHLEGLDRQGMHQYIKHHLKLAGIKNNLFEDSALTAIHQGSGGLLRKSNHLARGALIAAATSKSTQVVAEHVRLAATEIF
ncbi:MAG: AAA family ATPase [Desulfobacteraceae bacterium]|jgi:type II secretory pathway predicted ATPase ExeA